MLEKSNKVGDWFMIKATWTATMGRGSNFPQVKIQKEYIIFQNYT